MFCMPRAYVPAIVWYSVGLFRHARRRKGAKKVADQNGVQMAAVQLASFLVLHRYNN